MSLPGYFFLGFQFRGSTNFEVLLDDFIGNPCNRVYLTTFNWTAPRKQGLFWGRSPATIVRTQDENLTKSTGAFFDKYFYFVAIF